VDLAAPAAAPVLHVSPNFQSQQLDDLRYYAPVLIEG